MHLGNGASVVAIQDGVCIDTSMGMTPTEGLVMGTRCGDVDPSLHFYLTRSLGMRIDEIETMLNHDRYHLVGDVVDRVPKPGYKAAYLKQFVRDKLIEHK